MGNGAVADFARGPRAWTRIGWLAVGVLIGTIGLALLFSARSSAAPTAVYSTDFEAGVGPEWSNSEAEVSPDGEGFTGRFDEEESTILSLAGLPAHNVAVVEFDIYIFDSMDGNDTGPGSGEEDEGSHPDIFRFSADGALLKQTTFGNRHPQAFPGDYPGASNPPKTGATAEDDLGYDESTTFRVVLSFPHTASTLAFTAAGTGLEDANDESWGLDNVSVSTEQGPAAPRVGPPVPSDFATALFDGTTLYLRVKCPARFKPRCLGTAAGFTSKTRCTHSKGRRHCKAVRPITASASASQKPNKWKVFALKVKPKYRKVVKKMAKKPNKKLLYVREQIHAKRFKHGRRQAVYHKYRVLTASN
jgi:hypothetical protein